ncbi:MAG TPA: hypothetical protein VL547_21995 [Dinghuibacter sp.]|jgi:hypothetical protein|uniref:hypothetical protein n=1 Tax=Dinghuibacter sp. TaxID=2024697 RepID=UPI002C49BCE9|nr:hypothetical protein [Dinghuibacter sp.]HTJ14733.1 hypothetical protein [Dinghuibacter sp.]
MFQFYLILAAALALIGWASYTIAGVVYRYLAGSRYARLLQVLAGIVSFIVIFAAVAFLFIANMRIER